jgi:hypothetical protein
MTDKPIKIEALKILEVLATSPFTECHSLTREFANVPARPGVYAFRHQHQGILYIGKSFDVKQRLRGGHKALGWAFIDRQPLSAMDREGN